MFGFFCLWPLSPTGRGNVLKKRTGMDSNSIGVTKKFVFIIKAKDGK